MDMVDKEDARTCGAGAPRDDQRQVELGLRAALAQESAEVH